MQHRLSLYLLLTHRSDIKFCRIKISIWCGLSSKFFDQLILSVIIIIIINCPFVFILRIERDWKTFSIFSRYCRCNKTAIKTAAAAAATLNMQYQSLVVSCMSGHIVHISRILCRLVTVVVEPTWSADNHACWLYWRHALLYGRHCNSYRYYCCCCCCVSRSALLYCDSVFAVPSLL